MAKHVRFPCGSWLASSDEVHSVLCLVPLSFYSALQVDFIAGREIEIGGIYKGVVTSVKEYGAFVEFNGGQQGLLHISELSHEPVCSMDGEVFLESLLLIAPHPIIAPLFLLESFVCYSVKFFVLLSILCYEYICIVALNPYCSFQYL